MIVVLVGGLLNDSLRPALKVRASGRAVLRDREERAFDTPVGFVEHAGVEVVGKQDRSVGGSRRHGDRRKH